MIKNCADGRGLAKGREQKVRQDGPRRVDSVTRGQQSCEGMRNWTSIGGGKRIRKCARISMQELRGGRDRSWPGIVRRLLTEASKGDEPVNEDSWRNGNVSSEKRLVRHETWSGQSKKLGGSA